MDIRTPNVHYKHRVERAAEEYLASTGVVQAVSGALRSLFSAPWLPDNPYYHLHDALGAYADQSSAWQQDSQVLLAGRGPEGGLEVQVPELQLCKLQGLDCCYGLPHVLRVVHRGACQRLQLLLGSGVPDVLFPGPTPCNAAQGYTLQVLASVQGAACVWNPVAQALPALEVRADVVVTGPLVEEAVQLFLDQVLTEAQELQEVPLYFVEGVGVKEVDQLHLDQGQRADLSRPTPLQEVLEQRQQWRRLATRRVLGGSCVELTAVLFLDTGPHLQPNLYQGAAGGEGAAGRVSGSVAGAGEGAAARPGSRQGQGGPPSLRHHAVVKQFYFHYVSLQESRVAFDHMQHYACLPFDALYTGYFTSLTAARQYMQLYLVTDKGPYHPACLQANTANIKRMVQQQMDQGDSLRAHCLLLYLVMLQDADVTNARGLQGSMLRPLRDLVRGPVTTLGAAPPQQPGTASIFGVVPSLVRILESAAAVVQGLTHELGAIETARVGWPPKKAMLEARAGGDQPTSRPGTAGSHGSRGSSGAVMLAWLRGFDMESQLLTQLCAVRHRIEVASSQGLLPGLSALVDQLALRLPSQPPRTGSARLLEQLQSPLMQLRMLLGAATRSMVHTYLARCPDIPQAMAQLGLSAALPSPPRPSPALLPAPGQVPGQGAAGRLDGGGQEALAPAAFVPEFVLHVAHVVGSLVKEGAAPQFIAEEAVRLQYAVDCRLDDCLAAIWTQAAEPPQVANPFPRMLRLVRAQAARMELWRDDLDSALSLLLNDLECPDPPSFIHAARPSSARLKADRQQAGRRGPLARPPAQGGAEPACVYGSHAAVAMADAEALQGLGAAWPDLLAGRYWQQGAFRGEVVPCLVADSWMTNALDLDLGQPQYHTAIGQQPPPPPPLHGLRCQELHLVEGPSCRGGAEAFASQLLSRCLHLHQRTQHLVVQLQLWRPASHTDPGVPAAPGPSAGLLGQGPGQGRGQGQGQGEGPGQGPGRGLDGAGRAWGQEEPGVSTQGARLRRVTWEVAELQQPDRRGEVEAAVAEAALAVPQGTALGCLLLYAAEQQGGLVQQGYTRLRQDLVFQFRRQRPTEAGLQPLGHAVSVLQRPPSAGMAGAGADRAVHQRVFLSHSHASTWHAWNHSEGDPGHPSRLQHHVFASKQAGALLLREGRLLAAHKAALAAAVALQDGAGVYELSRSSQSAAHALAWLLELGQSVAELMGGAAAPLAALASKLDPQRLRCLVWVFTSSMRRCMSTPRACPCASLRGLILGLLEELQPAVLASLRLGVREAEVLEQLLVWIRACGLSIEADVHACLDSGVRAEWLLEGGSSPCDPRPTSPYMVPGSQVLRPGSASAAGRPRTADIGSFGGMATWHRPAGAASELQLEDD